MVSVSAAIEGWNRRGSAPTWVPQHHYYAAAATKYARWRSGYEYEGRPTTVLPARDGYSTCVDCHDTHSLELKVEECAGCHAESLR